MVDTPLRQGIGVALGKPPALLASRIGSGASPGRRAGSQRR
jgi:hypothetical protein